MRKGGDLTAAIGKMKIEGSGPESLPQSPTLTIHETPKYSLRQAESAKAAAEFSLLILEYLHKEGPLLENGHNKNNNK